MKRREFLKKTAVVAGGMALENAYAAPCTPDVHGSSGHPCVPGPAPNWFLNMAENTWTSPAINTVADVFDGAPNDAIMTAWTGGAVDQVRGELILAANGGHTDYSGNEVYACQIRQESPEWVRLTDKSLVIEGDDRNNDSAAYPDGTPRAVHGWSHASFAEGKFWYLGMTGQYRRGSQSSAVWSLNRDAIGTNYPMSAVDAPWQYHGLGVPDDITGRWGSEIDWQSSSTAYDRDTKKLWSSCTFTVATPRHPFFSVDAVSGEITNYPTITDKVGASGQGTLKHSISVIVDSVWIIIAPNRVSQIWLLDLKNPTAGFVRRTTTGTQSAFISGGGPGCVYHRSTNSILVYNHTYGRDLRKLTIPADKFNGTWEWSSVSGGGELPTGQKGGFRGVYSKFNIIDDMGNGQSALVVALNVSSPVFVYKLPMIAT